MNELTDRMHIRCFEARDAEICFRIRSAAFIQKFYGELGARATSAGINAFMPDDYIRMAQTTPFFVAEIAGDIIGFFTIERKDTVAAEIPLIYIDLKHLGNKIGRAFIEYIEQWVKAKWPEVTTLIVETVIPEYNSPFYRKVGFLPSGKAVCHFPAMDVPALRLEKKFDT
jgi:GNAT superfamily N-acetyltransferase